MTEESIYTDESIYKDTEDADADNGKTLSVPDKTKSVKRSFRKSVLMIEKEAKEELKSDAASMLRACPHYPQPALLSSFRMPHRNRFTAPA